MMVMKVFVERIVLDDPIIKRSCFKYDYPLRSCLKNNYKKVFQ